MIIVLTVQPDPRGQAQLNILVEGGNGVLIHQALTAALAQTEQQFPEAAAASRKPQLIVPTPDLHSVLKNLNNGKK
jgi:hypothetical protein